MPTLTVKRQFMGLRYNLLPIEARLDRTRTDTQGGRHHGSAWRNYRNCDVPRQDCRSRRCRGHPSRSRGSLRRPPHPTSRKYSRPSMQHAMHLTEQALKNGDLPVLGWQLNRFRSEIHGGLVARNERKLRWALKISVPYCVATLKVGREGHVAAAVEIAMLIVQDAVESGYAIGLTMVTITWTKALLTAVTGGKACVVERAL